MKNKDKLTEIKEFYNDKIKKWHIITFIIVAVLYTITFFAQVYTLKNGEYIKRIGIHGNGWSKLEYNGQTVYAISSYLVQ